MWFAILQRFSILISVVLAVSLTALRPAAAETLVVPFQCTMEKGEPRLSPAAETQYKIIGVREEQPFAFCERGATGACVTMMVHRFAVMCSGTRVQWAKFAAASQIQGVKLPPGLPLGFAPVSAMAGRFVLPSLTKIANNGPSTSVEMQELSIESVIDRHTSADFTDPMTETSPWETIVQADVLPIAEHGIARVAGTLIALVLMLAAASMVAAGRWRSAAQISAYVADVRIHLNNHVLPKIADVCRTAVARARAAANASFEAWQHNERAHPDDALSHSAMILQARLAETDLLVATLSDGLLLRDVLQSEIDRVRERGMDTEKNLRRRSPDKSAAVFRTLLRELDRISRIAQSALQSNQQDYDMPRAAPSLEMPQTQSEAYRMLGLNADAPPAVAKKLVDALRMTWHPDYARDDEDRRRREERMKQINAAWDMIKQQRAAA